MPVTQEQATWFADAFQKLVANVDKAIVGKDHVIRSCSRRCSPTATCCSRTSRAPARPCSRRRSRTRSTARTRRIQFTPDLLPSDVTGVTIYDQGKGVFEFHPGPIFASIVLADEINRASPKTQSRAARGHGGGRRHGRRRGPLGRQPRSWSSPPRTRSSRREPTSCPRRSSTASSSRRRSATPTRKTAVALLMDSSTRARASLVSPDHQARVDRGDVGARRRGATSTSRSCSTSATSSTATRKRPGRRARRQHARRDGARARRRRPGRSRRDAPTSPPTTCATSPCRCSRTASSIDPESEFAGVTAEDIVSRILVDIEPPAYRAA